MAVKILERGFTFDDVLIVPSASAMEPAEASLLKKLCGI
jgi:IMP dehydrogenase/GMP reductase